uniref:Uncharacterized protein n=1 Tax=Arundo donax TaxID=35708 RepID=A0A0A9GI61_ARUDO
MVRHIFTFLQYKSVSHATLDIIPQFYRLAKQRTLLVSSLSSLQSLPNPIIDNPKDCCVPRSPQF